MYQEIAQVLLEIINFASNDVYSNLYAFRTLTALYRAENNLFNINSNVVISILFKVLNTSNQGKEGT